jgi:hypothetical protein
MARTEFCNFEGALHIKGTIEDFWRSAGHKVDIKLVDAGFHASIRSSRYDVRSDMLNGYPRGFLKKPQ